MLREVPSATDELPSMALSLQGGGSIGVDPRKSQEGRAKSAENLFVMDLQLPPDAPRGYGRARLCEVLPRAPADRAASTMVPDGAAPAKTLMEETHPARALPLGRHTDRHSRIRVALVVTVLLL